MSEYICLLLIAKAAICCATYETLDRHFFNSIFRKKNKDFWYMRQSWQRAKQIFGYRIDAWHLFKSAMIIQLMIVPLVYEGYFNWWIDLAIGGTVWNLTFSLFYHKVLRK